VRGGGDDAARACRVERGKVLVREREDQLHDPGSRFLEIAPSSVELHDDQDGASM
jgi:acetyl-CoA carboxylase carboxyltransferase component